MFVRTGQRAQPYNKVDKDLMRVFSLIHRKATAIFLHFKNGMQNVGHVTRDEHTEFTEKKAIRYQYPPGQADAEHRKL